MLLRDGIEQPLIPRYFDLLVFLIERRHEAVHRRDIFDRVWNDVVVSDSALSQAIRTIRRTLGDDSREPRFIRTVSRHGYRFVYVDVVEEEDDGMEVTTVRGGPVQPDQQRPPEGGGRTEVSAPTAIASAVDPFDLPLQVVTRAAATSDEQEAQREAAEVLHSLGTEEALERLGTRPRHAFARALLRDTRWDIPRAGAVPILGQPAPLATAAALIALRLRRAARIAATRWAAASVGGGIAGLVGGIGGGLLLVAAPGSATPIAAVAVLAFISVCSGAGVGGGWSGAESAVRSLRPVALVAGAAIGGGFVGALVEWISRWSLEALVGLHVDIGGGLEGVVIGAAAGFGYAATTSGDGGLAAPRGGRRLRAAIATAVACGLAALLLAVSGRPLVGGTIHAIAHASHGSQVELTPFSRWVGEPDFGPVSRALIGTGEGALFGLGLALGLTRRPR